MHGHCSFVVKDQEDDFEEVTDLVGSENEGTVGRIVVAKVIDDELVIEGVLDVFVGASVSACRGVELHKSNRNTIKVRVMRSAPIEKRGIDGAAQLLSLVTIHSRGEECRGPAASHEGPGQRSRPVTNGGHRILTRTYNRLTGGQEVVGSNPASPTTKPQVRAGLSRPALWFTGSEKANVLQMFCVVPVHA